MYVLIFQRFFRVCYSILYISFQFFCDLFKSCAPCSVLCIRVLLCGIRMPKSGGVQVSTYKHMTNLGGVAFG